MTTPSIVFVPMYKFNFSISSKDKQNIELIRKSKLACRMNQYARCIFKIWYTSIFYIKNYCVAETELFNSNNQITQITMCMTAIGPHFPCTKTYALKENICIVCGWTPSSRLSCICKMWMRLRENETFFVKKAKFLRRHIKDFHS